MPSSRFAFLLTCSLVLSFYSTGPALAAAPAQVLEAEIVIYGGTSAGVAAAVECSRLGKSSLIIEPSNHLGGLTSGGLGWTDSGNKAVIGGISREYYQRIKREYDRPETWAWQKSSEYNRYDPKSDALWVFEPHVAEKVYRDLVQEYKIPVYFNERLDLKKPVLKQGSQIVEFVLESGIRVRGKRFIDATYEGDLMAKAGISYTVGREANSQYNETINGVQKVKTVKHQFEASISPFKIPGNPASGLLPGIHGDDPGEDGQGDHRVQAYCFRMCLTNHPENRIPFPKPEGYDPERYELLARYLATGWDHLFNKFDVIPNRKTDTNNHGAFSTDNIGMNYDYPDGDYATRDRIFEEHRVYQQGLMWFLANDKRVPAKIQSTLNQWGLAADEFVDHNNWPHQLYIREARRMVSDFVMTELHLRRQHSTPDPIGMGSYNMDSHNVQRYVTPEGFARNEGDIQINPGGPYPVSYRAIVPREQECSNLLVPVCLSSSHIAYGSIRMEPVFMILAHSAAAAACQSLDDHCSVQQIDYQKLSKQLLDEKQVLDYTGPYGVTRINIDVKSLPGMILDDDQAKLNGSWIPSTSSHVYLGGQYLHDNNESQGFRTATFEFNVPESGTYEVQVSHAPNNNRATNVMVTVESADGTSSKKVNQRLAPTIDKAFVTLGKYVFEKNQAGRVIISNEEADGYVTVDAVRILPMKSSSE